ncbi:MAG: diguanylate cyclase [Methylobacter tundripaludum]|nr:diguanylate cyclase [Methylobacter tundripaludum]
MTDSTDFSAQLAALREQYAKRLVHTLDNLLSRVKGKGADIAPIILSELHADLHKLAGSGGTFGFFELSRQARILEVAVKVWLDDLSVLEAAQWEAWKNDLSALQQAFMTDAAFDASAGKALLVPPLLGQNEHVRVILIEDEALIAYELNKGLSQFGYEVSHCADFSAAEAEIRAGMPDVLVVDSMLPGQNPADSTEALPLLFERLGYRLPTVFLADRIDFPSRLAAARAGGGAFLTKSTDISTLAGRIEMLLREHDHAPYRVLIVDDDEVLAEHYRLTLKAAGMLAEKVCRPEETLAAMQSLNPDLLIIDLYMPDCNGADLALAIRYEDAWMSLPIIYLSAADDLDEQIKALSNGGDDFLTKPVSDARLVSTVQVRAARARKVSELMSQDSLTGLLKHSTIKDRLAIEIERAHRQGKVMAMAMVDLDNFKQVNDTWGHPMGDQVIKTLAHLLRQRLRRQDSIGRYGGEEFAVVLPECNAADAMRLLDDIRQRFAEMRFIHEGQSFGITLSAGVATSKQCTDAPGLLAAADAALYKAKDGGRNQVCQFCGY